MALTTGERDSWPYTDLHVKPYAQRHVKVYADRQPGPVMDAQRDRLQSVATMPNVTLSVTTASYPYLHPFVIWQLEDETLVTVETYSAELQVRETEDVERYSEVWRRLSERARRLY